MLTLTDKNILITGASSGIGRQCAIDASHLGANVVFLGRNEQRLNQTLDQMKQANHQMVAQDITEYNELEKVVRQAVEKVGKISGFIHSAGIEDTVPLRDMTVEKYQEMFSVNVFSGLELARLLSKKKYLNTAGASFLFISSVMGVLGQPAKVGYCCTKSAMISAVKALALEPVVKKIRSNCVLPGVVLSEMTQRSLTQMTQESKDAIRDMHPLGFGDPKDVSNLCMFLLSDLSKWITGTSIIVDGGYSAA